MFSPNRIRVIAFLASWAQPAAAVIAQDAASGPRGGAPALQPLEAAIAAGNWIRHHQIENERGMVWPTVPDESPDVQRNLYSGTPGIILFFLELGRATGDESWTADAKRGADDLIASLPETHEGADFGLWTGLAGQAFTLHRVYVATGEEKYLQGARRGLELIRAGAVADEDGAGVHWNEVTDIIGGTAGIGLFLLYAADAMEEPGMLDLAIKAGDHLISRGRSVDLPLGGTGLKWSMTDEFPRLMPNFSHGTAGISYFLVSLHDELKTRGLLRDDRFLDAGTDGAQYVVSISDPSNGGFLVFHHEPEGEDLYYLGWCHGPVGTARLIYRLAIVSESESLGTVVGRCARSIMTSGIPDQRTPGFWDNVGPCCGSAGVAEFFLKMSTLYQKPEYEVFARAMHEDIMKRATRVDLPDGKVGLKWIQAEHRVRPEFLQAQTGYMQGASGIGLWLLRLHAFDTGKDFDLRFPDSPY
jgi:lantibiotic modifying enzyme